MCFGMNCTHQHYFTGECRGAIDWNSPDAACRDAEEEREERLNHAIDTENFDLWLENLPDEDD